MLLPLLVSLVWLTCVPWTFAATASSVVPTATLAARSVPISTLSPVSLRLPKELESVRDLSLFYVGQGFQTQTTVYAMITGKPNEGDGPKTNYMYQDNTALEVDHLPMTARVKGKTQTGLFGLKCSMASSQRNWACKYGIETTGVTSTYTSFTTPMRPVTAFTPVQGLIQSIRKETASQGPQATRTSDMQSATNAGGLVPMRVGPMLVAFTTAFVVAGAWLL
ncbi:hypothetical protein MNAN1_001023 [Malassezia nana]|uniref:Uncharacterized protein n=1 Tax=Malassezia nana TaxID=180528 RepID=A0AAF0J2U6_9BASI|nr:hypothetical protein MNAN1_001023 [Malassezia nana]